MAVQNQSFSAAVDAWVRETEARMQAVLRESCQRLVAVAQKPVGEGGNMPIDTGYLRYSGQASKAAPTPILLDFKPDKSGTYTFSFDQTSGILATLKPGETFFFCWTAAYAARIEYGFTGQDKLGRSYSQAGRGYVRLAAQKWQRIVREASLDAQRLAALPKP